MANEKRLVSLDVVLTGIATFKECYEGVGLKPWVVEHIQTALQMVERFVKEIPTVDAVEVVHGRWAALDDDCEELEGEDEAMRWGCSACHEIVEYDDWTHRSRLTRFCPNCGAKMDGGKDNG